MRVVLGFLLVGTVVSASCLEPTEVNVTIKTDLRCSVEEMGKYQLDRTDVQVVVDGQTRSVGTKEGCSKGRVGNVVFVPGNHPEVHLRVVGAVQGEPDPIVAERILRFLPHQSLALDVELSTACVGVKCDTGFTCKDGTCVPIPQNVPSPDGGDLVDGPNPTLDSGMLVDGAFDGSAILDASKDTNATLDSGKCGVPPFNTIDVHWGFNEGQMSPVTRDDSMTYVATLTSGVSLLPNTSQPLCGSMLSYTATATQDLLTTQWKPSGSFSIAFGFQYVSGTGVVISRNTGAIGGWEFRMAANNTLAFTVWDNQKYMITQTCQVTSKPIAVVANVSLNKAAWSIDMGACGGTLNPNLTVTPYTANVFVGQQGVKFNLDELYLGQ